MNFSRLVSNHMSNHGHTVYCCKQCLHVYKTLELLDAHATNRQRTTFPDDLRCRFTTHRNKLPAHFVVYADLS